MCRETREMVAMRSSINFIMFLYLVLVSLAPLSTFAFEPDDVYFEYYCTDNGGNFTANSPYQANLKSVVSQLSDLTEFSNGFYNLSSGKSPDNVNAIAHCTGDRSRNECISCIGYTITKLRGFCPWNKESIAWSQYCMVRYANRNLFGKLENRPRRCAPSPNFASNPEEFDGVVRQLLGNLSVNATSGGPLVKYAADQTRAGFDTVYGMVQCTPDLDDRSCSSCLNFSTTELLSCCSGKTGCRDLSPSCFLRFEAGDPFYQTGFRSPPSSPTSTTPPTSTKPPTSREGKSSNATRTVIIVIASVVGLVILIVLPICIFKRQTKTLEKPINVDDITEAESLQFNFATIQNATNNFSDANKIGQGGFGTVYKGLLPGGQEIAVKRLSVNSGQGDLEFKNEVLVVAKLQHRNLVRLLGFSLKGNETLLIYEFVPNGSLDHFIFDPIKRARLDWQTRYRIIVGIARGLLYLHEDSRLRIIHRDLKASNVLLDAEMIPRIADFGTAKLFGQDETRGNTNRIVGTYGYMAPEYVIHGQFSVKSDVFSFGVLVLEIISGQKSNRFRYNESDEYLLNFAWRNWKEGTVLYLVDPNLSDGYRDEIMRCIHIGLMCVQENVAARPTMASVVFMLNSHSTTIPVPSQPPFGMNSNVISEMSASMGTFSWVSDSNQSMSQPLPPSQNEVSITELGPR